MKKLTLEYSYLKNHVRNDEMEQMLCFAKNAAQTLQEESGAGNDFLGWQNLPQNYDKKEFERIKQAAKKINSHSEYLITIGIGGSYLGAKAVIEALKNPFAKSKTTVIFAGNSISGVYLAQLVEFIKEKEFSINVISKSGTTTEPAIAFRILREVLESRYGKEEAKNRIFVTTDAKRGALKKLADEEGYETFVIADNIGGRYSVLTAVGLLPIAVEGFDIDRLMQGAFDCMEEIKNTTGTENICQSYAAIRNILYNKGKNIELLVSYEPNLQSFSEWYKQLFGESEGKDGKGIFPASVIFSTDLHSMGQYIQDGRRMLFETVLRIEKPGVDIEIPYMEDDIDGINYISGKTVDLINQKALEATAMAHIKGNVPNLLINLPELNEYYIGYLMYFFEKACAISGYLLVVNPFNQPGVEEYKKNMFHLLGKEGY